MRRTWLGVLFFTWPYGVPFLLLVGIERRTSRPYIPTHADAVAFGTVTDTLLWTGLILNVVLPLGGLLLARSFDDAFWRRHFGLALIGTALIFLAVAMVSGSSSTGLLGHLPADQEPTPRITQCIPRSGGHGCPGG